LLMRPMASKVTMMIIMYKFMGKVCGMNFQTRGVRNVTV